MSASACGPTPARRPGVDDLRIYGSALEGCEWDLSDNTCHFGAPPGAVAALAALDPALVSRYPSASNGALREELARLGGVTPAEVVTGCGSDDLLDSALRAFGTPGDSIAFLAPTFVMLEHFAISNSLTPVPVLSPGGVASDPEALLAVRARHVYLCSPNNPTGGVLPKGFLERVLAETEGLVILDEAYVEFSGGSMAGFAPAQGRLLVLRTLSKAYALAGLRVGWGVGAEELVLAIERVRGPFRLTVPSEAAAHAALSSDPGWVCRHVEQAVQARERFAEGLRGGGFAPRPSEANFLLVPVQDAAAAASALLSRGIGVRAFAKLPGIGDALRITVAPWPVLQTVLTAMRALVVPADFRGPA